MYLDDDKCESCPGILEELETIDDDTDEHGIQFVKSNDVKLAHEIGIFSFPALVYYEVGVPIMYDGNTSFCFIWIFKAPSKWSDLEKRYILGFNFQFSSYSKGYSKSLTAITTRTGIPSVFGVIDSKSGIQNYLRSQKKPNIGFSSLNPRKYLLINSCTWKEFKNVKKP